MIYLLRRLMEKYREEKNCTYGFQDEVPWCMLFAENIVLFDETIGGLNAKLETWRATLERKLAQDR